jgi:hypothetical protein
MLFRLHESAQEALFFNTHSGFLEGLVRVSFPQRSF